MTQADLDDIMSSIRTSVEAESGKPPEGSADLIEQAAAEAAVAETQEASADDDVLELTAADMTAAPAPTPVPTPNSSPAPAPAPAPAPDAAIAEVLGVPSLSPADEAADEFDKLLAEISAEKQTRAAEVAAVKEALLADIEPLGATEKPAPEVLEEVPVETAPAAEEAAVEATVTETPDSAEASAKPVVHASAQSAPVPLTSMPMLAATTHEMGMIAGQSGGMQLTLPAEVLAMALRPMVQNWLNANLPNVVERLVREEIAKLNG